MYTHMCIYRGILIHRYIFPDNGARNDMIYIYVCTYIYVFMYYYIYTCTNAFRRWSNRKLIMGWLRSVGSIKL